MSFASDVFTYLELRGIPNNLLDYLVDRKVNPDFSIEEIVAHREIYGFFNGWLDGTAHTHYDNHLMNRSGFLVWKDLVDRFLARTPQRMAAVGLELQNIEFQPGNSKETIL